MFKKCVREASLAFVGYVAGYTFAHVAFCDDSCPFEEKKMLKGASAMFALSFVMNAANSLFSK